MLQKLEIKIQRINQQTQKIKFKLYDDLTQKKLNLMLMVMVCFSIWNRP